MPEGQRGKIALTDQELLKLYIGLVPFLAQVCGPGSEVVVHDVTRPESSIVAIGNGVSGREIGNPMTNLAQELTRKGTYEENEYLLNYQGQAKTGKFLSSTYFIKNEGRLIGMLCINKEMTAVQELNEAVQYLLDRFNLTAPAEDTPSENLDNPISDMVHTRITEIIAQSGVLPRKMTLNEKIRVVHRLNDEGVLRMKGAVPEIAAQLGVSVTTIYRYLNKSVQ